MKEGTNFKDRKKEHTISDIILIRRLIKYLFLKKKLMLLTLIFIFVSLIVQVIAPYIMTIIIDDAVITLQDKNYLIFLSIVLIVAYFISNLARYFTAWLFSYIGEHVLYRIRKDTFVKVQDLSMNYFDSTPTGDIIARMTSDLETMTTLLSGQVLRVFISIIFLIGTIYVMISISPVLTLAVTICFPVLVAISVINKFYLRPVSKEFRKTNAMLTSTMTENIMGARVSRAFAREEYNQIEFEKVNQQYSDDLMKAVKIGAIINPFYEYYETISSVVVLVVGGILVITFGNITPGILVLFVIYISQFIWPLLELVNVYGQIQSAFAAWERIVKILDHPVKIQEKENAQPLIAMNGKIQFQNVKFAYNSETPIILDDFNLTISPGETVAIVGPTGSGKTTLVKLIARFYDPQEGKILIDDIDIKECTLHSLKDTVGFVLQHPALFSESIHYNVSYGRNGSKVSDEAINEVLNLIGADFIFKLSEGVNTMVGERGSRISVGQKQLISFARVLLTNPRILLLDEATSSIDPQTELKIQKALKKLTKDRTSIIIAHRLSTIRSVDRIIVLDQGKIVEEGSFDELLKQKGSFHELYQLQFK